MVYVCMSSWSLPSSEISLKGRCSKVKIRCTVKNWICPKAWMWVNGVGELGTCPWDVSVKAVIAGEKQLKKKWMCEWIYGYPIENSKDMNYKWILNCFQKVVVHLNPLIHYYIQAISIQTIPELVYRLGIHRSAQTHSSSILFLFSLQTRACGG